MTEPFKRRIHIAGNGLIALIIIILGILSFFIPGLQVLALAFGLSASFAPLIVFAIGVIVGILWNAGFTLVNWLTTRNPSNIKMDEPKEKYTEQKATQDTSTNDFKAGLFAASTSHSPNYSDPRLTELHKLFFTIFLNRKGLAPNSKWTSEERAFIDNLWIKPEIINNKSCFVLYSVENSPDVLQKFQLLQRLQNLAAHYIFVDTINSPLRLEGFTNSENSTISYKLYIESENIDKMLNFRQKLEEIKLIQELLKSECKINFDIKSTYKHDKYPDGTLFLFKKAIDMTSLYATSKQVNNLVNSEHGSNERVMVAKSSIYGNGTPEGTFIFPNEFPPLLALVKRQSYSPSPSNS